MSRGPSPGGAPRPARTRTAATAVALLVLLLVAVLAGLLRGGPAGTAEEATRTGSEPASSTAVRSPAPRTPSPAVRDPESGLRVVALSSLPREAQETVALVERGGPFPYVQDGATFANREGRLPAHPRGWYREYTVRTPGEDDRGPRRIVTGDDDRQVFYTADHYDSFVRVAR